MADQCRNCGAELFYGQRFCRVCGKTTDTVSEENAPTQRMPPPPDTWGSRQANTAPTAGQDTRPVYTPPNYYQPPTPIQPYTPPRSRPVWPWIVALIGAGMLVAMILGVVFISRSPRMGRDIADRIERERKARGAVPAPPASPDIPAPPLPPLPPLPPGAEAVLGADNAEVDASDAETVLTKKFPLDKTAVVTLTNVNGDITIESSDGPDAELTVIKRGDSEQSRNSAQVKFFSDRGRLSLRTELPPGSRNLSVHYELKLPREVGRVEIKLTNGDIKVSDITSHIAVYTTNGDIGLSDVTGVASAQTVNGSIEAQLAKVIPGRPMDFSSVHGNIDVSFSSDFNANLSASTMAGSITLDDDFGIRVQRQMVGQQANGPIGQGGPPLTVKTINGNIKLTR